MSYPMLRTGTVRAAFPRPVSGTSSSTLIDPIWFVFAACTGGSLCKGVGRGGKIFLPLFSFFHFLFTPLSPFLDVNLHVSWTSSN